MSILAYAFFPLIGLAIPYVTLREMHRASKTKIISNSKVNRGIHYAE